MMRGLATELVQKKESIEYSHIYYRIDIDYNISTVKYHHLLKMIYHTSGAVLQGETYEKTSIWR